jgi:hypothetical protein
VTSAGIHAALGAAKRTSLPIALVLLCATDAMAREPAPAFVPDSWAGPYIGAYYAVAAGGRSSELADEAHIQQSTSTLMKGNFSGQVTGSMVDLLVVACGVSLSPFRDRPQRGARYRHLPVVDPP